MPSIKDGDTSGIIAFDRNHGLPGKDVTDMVYTLIERDGKMYVGTANGLTVVQLRMRKATAK